MSSSDSKNLRDSLDGREKFCSRCQDWWPADREFFYSNPGKVANLADWCKACYADHRSEDEALMRRLG